MMDTFPDLGSLSDQELKDLIQQLTDEEQEVSYRRRILHGKIDILRAELVNRLRKKHEGGEDVISGADVQRLTDILAGRAPAAATTSSRRRGPARGASLPRVRVRRHRGGELLPASCGAFQSAPREATRDDATTATYVIDEQTGELRPVDVGDVAAAERRARRSAPAAAASASRSRCTGERMTIGRSPDAEIFLDDVTVSRDHAVLVRRSGALVPRRLRLAERHVRQPPPDRLAQARGRRRAADRQVQAHLPRALRWPCPTTPHRSGDAADGGRAPARGRSSASKSLTIGAVCKALPAGVPGHLDLQDPLPGGPEAADAAAHARRLPALLARPTSRACARSCACSATSSCRCG